MSGMAHGYAWATISGSRFETMHEYVAPHAHETSGGTGIILARQNPNIWTLTVITAVAINYVSEATSAIQLLWDAPVPHR